MPGETSLPLIFDLVTQKEYVVMGVLIYYSETVLKSLCSLNPYERWNIASKGISPINEKKLKYNPDYCMTLDDYLLVIEKAGWFKLKKNTP